MWNPLKLVLNKVWLALGAAALACITWLKLSNARLKGKLAKRDSDDARARTDALREVLDKDREAEQRGQENEAKELAEAKSGKRNHFDNDF